MKHYKSDKYERTSKREAFNLLDTLRGNIAVQPCNLSPDGYYFAPYILSMDYFRLQLIEQKKTPRELFDSIINNYTYHNCNHETGYYPSFYLVRD